MKERGLVFLDFPGVKLPESSVDFLSSNFLYQVARSEAILKWFNGGLDRTKKPPSSLKEYSKSRTGPKRGKYVSGLDGLYRKAKKGELVVMPDSGHFGELLIGEFLDDPGHEVYVRPSAKYEEFNVPARRVKWLGRKPQYQLTPEFLKSLRTNPFVLVKRSHRKPVYDIAYPSYQIGDEFSASFKVSGDIFTSRDDYYLQQFINYVAALVENYENQSSDISQDIFSAITDMQDLDFVPELAISINSPGSIWQFCNKITPFVAVAMMALAQSACSPDGTYTTINPDSIQLTSIDGNQDDCIFEVEQSVRHAMRMIDVDNWERLCKNAKALQEGPELSAPATVID